MSIVWECGSCGERSLERRCGECNLFCSRVGAGGECPACSELEGLAKPGQHGEHRKVFHEQRATHVQGNVWQFEARYGQVHV